MTAKGDMSALSIVLGASGPVLLVAWVLVVTALLVWTLIVVKARQLHRLQQAERAFEHTTRGARQLAVIHEACRRNPQALGARLTEAVLDSATAFATIDAAVEQAVACEGASVYRHMTMLATVGATAPFVGLLGTVYGILDAFLRIGAAQSASLTVVAPAIGEALVATAIGLFAAIPAVVGYNHLARGLDDLTARARANARYWAVTAFAVRAGQG
ncbi:MAG TPA: MotA/TolQ/ExbB proton channel family protein [Nannocystaceae bacterium]|nr:MotA/TolQ/ExbB proton channel family protein [Nannocystaceae bacterium]